jgi:arginase family enzyme
MKTTAVFFPFDLFGSAGAGAGVGLVADELREILADNRRETVPTRARCYTEQIRLKEFGFETPDAYVTWREQGRRAARSVLRQGDFLLWVSGNHLGALPVYDELSGSGDEVLVVQLDAHLDIHHFRDCTSELSHGNFLLHCAGPLPPLFNVGHRDLLLPADHVGRAYRRTFSAADLAIDASRVLDAIRGAVGRAARVYLDIDCDVFDPVYFPGVGQPVPFGLSPPQVLAVVDAVSGPGLAGLMVSEFDPGRDRDDRSLGTLMWLIEYVLLRRYEGTAQAGSR